FFNFRYFLHISPLPPSSTLFPYTTLFRSICMISKELLREKTIAFLEYMGVYIDNLEDNEKLEEFADIIKNTEDSAEKTNGLVYRSEEHTSELQSRENLVCRLLLEKKKKKT